MGPLQAALLAEGVGHVSGLDALPLAPHQFVMQFPHLVVSSRAERPYVEAACLRAGYTIIAWADAAKVRAGRSADLVIIRSEGGKISERRGVTNGAAEPEKAWFDLARGSRDRVLPMAPFELGGYLSALLEHGVINERRLRRMIVDAHWWPTLGPAIDPLQAPDGDFARDLAEGRFG